MDTSLIYFSYDGKEYTVAMTAHDMNLIRLPDGRLLQVHGWRETLPPRPMSIQEMNSAVTVHAVDATEV